MTHKQLFGQMLIALGKQLTDTKSELYRSIDMSEEQLFSIVKFARILVSPAVQVLYIADLEERLGVTKATINNWIGMGLIRKGHKRKGDTRSFWYASEIDADEEILRRMGYVKKRKSKVAQEMQRARRFLNFEDCKEN